MWDRESAEERKKLKERLILLVNDALILANKVSTRDDSGNSWQRLIKPCPALADEVRCLQRTDFARQQFLPVRDQGEPLMPATGVTRALS